MPRPLRATLFFTDGPYGWSETHWNLTAADLDTALNDAVLLAGARSWLLASGPYIEFVRVSFDDTWRDTLVHQFIKPKLNDAGQPQSVNPGWINEESGVAWTVALLRAESGALYRKQIYVSGLPFLDESDIVPPGFDASFFQGMTHYANVLTGGKWGFKVWRRDVATYPYKAVTAVAAAAPFAWTIPAHGFLVGDRIRVFGSVAVGDTRKFNGVFHVQTVTDANNVTFSGFSYPAGSIFISGTAQKNAQDVVPYTNIIVRGLTHRKRGRPFDSPRGRSRPRTPAA